MRDDLSLKTVNNTAALTALSCGISSKTGVRRTEKQ
jgi:hypothetical protein